MPTLTGISDHMSGLLTTGSMLLCGIFVIWGGVQLIKRLASPDPYGAAPWGSTVLFLIAGGGLIAMGPVILPMLALGQDEPKADSSPTPTATPTATPSSVPTQAPRADPDPIVLPEIHNGSTILIVLAIVVVLAVGGLFATRALITTRAAVKRVRAEEAAREENRAKALAAWNRVIERHRTVNDKMLHAETEWDTLFSFPAINDPSVPETKRLLHAHRAVSAMSDDAPAGLDLDTDIAALPYPKLVAQLEEAWDAAWAHAQKVKTAGVPREERKKINQIVKLLRLAESPASTQNEREIAYLRAQSLIDELIIVKIPKRAALALESHKRLAITQAPAPATPISL